MPHTIYLALGTNLGHRLANLRAAIHSLAPQVRLQAESRIYETAPWGFLDQPAFLNMALRAETDLPPADLLAFLKQRETELGRVPTFRNGPRLIDIDILFYDDLVLNTPPLVIPHPRLQERDFVLIPLAEIAPNLVHPVLGQSIRALLQALAAAADPQCVLFDVQNAKNAEQTSN
ncbi:MAG: 2-amino-4-hydroxy-6-hydroxymethyldihydropteridine diphosphokinase [Anaerolineales bacterium]